MDEFEDESAPKNGDAGYCHPGPDCPRAAALMVAFLVPDSDGFPDGFE